MHKIILIGLILAGLIIKIKNKKKTKLDILIKIIFIVLSIGLFIICLAYLIILGPEYIPHAKTDFKSYADFREQTHDFYPDKQPLSAKDIKYYYYTGKFDTLSAVSFTVNGQDFVTLSEQYKTKFKEYDDYSSDGYVRYKNQTIPEDFIAEENLDFLNDMIDGNLSNYIIVEYMRTGNSESKTMLGTIGNASSGQFVIFYCRDAFPE